MQESSATFFEVYTKLESEERNNPNESAKKPKELPLSQIHEALEVFQPRDLAHDTAQKEHHIRTLIDAIYSESMNRLDPIVVWWSGRHWYVIDGHHRKQAYEQVNKQGKIKVSKIPVKAFDGSLVEAICEATRLNSKDKLAMTQDDKYNRAWVLVAMQYKLSRRAIANICKIGTATVSRMRKQLKEIQSVHPKDWQKEATGLTWREAQKFNQEAKLYDESWAERLAKEWAKRLSKAFGKKPVSQPEAFLKAIEIYSPQLAERLGEYLGVPLEHWGDENPDF